MSSDYRQCHFSNFFGLCTDVFSVEFSNLEGLQSTLLAETGGFLPINDTAVQILFERERNHWVTTSLHDGQVRLYDSCFHHHQLCASVEEQLVCIYKYQFKVTFYTGYSYTSTAANQECGLPSIAQEEMCHHFVQCFEARIKSDAFLGESKKVHMCALQSPFSFHLGCSYA